MESDSPGRPRSPHQLRPQQCSCFRGGLPGSPPPSQPVPHCTAPQRQPQGRKSRLIPLLPKPNPALRQGCPRAARGGPPAHEGAPAHAWARTQSSWVAARDTLLPLPGDLPRHPTRSAAKKKIIPGNRDTSVFQACTIKCHLIN